MDSDDRHYYCCGDCQALFSTLRGLSRHKGRCDGTKLLDGTYDLYAYRTAYLQNLADCCTHCQHRDVCPVLTHSLTAPKTTTSKRSRNSGRLVINKDRGAQVIKKETHQKRAAQGEDGGTMGTLVKKRKIYEPARLIVEMNTPPSGAKSTVLPAVNEELVSSGENRTFVYVVKREIVNKVAENLSVGPKGFTQKQDVHIDLPPTDTLETNSGPGPSTHEETLPVKVEDATTETKQDVVGAESECISANPESIINESPTVVEVLYDSNSARTQICGDEHDSSDHQGTSQNQTSTSPKNKPAITPSNPTVTPSNPSLIEQLRKFRQECPVEGKDKMALFYVCDVCDWKTPHVGFFARHQKSHNGSVAGSRWACKECDFTCKSKGQLKVHCDKHAKPFMCEFCSRRFARKKDLTRHLYIHSGDMPFKCSECEYGCRQPKSLAEHMRKHTGEQLCCVVEGCKFKSVYKWAMKSHFLNKHITDKRLQCPECAYKTNDSTSMLRHKRLHAGEKNFKCSVCSYRAVTKHEIVRHMRSHTKEKLYFCDRCKYSTAHASGLRIHMMNHLGVKPWQCVMCGYNSLTRSKVLRHVRQTHKGQGPEDPNDAVANLGLKLDIDIKEYKTPHEGSSTGEAARESDVVYNVEGIVQESDLENVEFIVQHLPTEESNFQVSAAAAEGGNRLETLDLTSIEGLQQFRQLTGNIEVKHVTIDPPGTQTVLQQAPPAQEEGPPVVEVQEVCDGGPETWQVVQIDAGPQEEGMVIEPQEEVVNAEGVGEQTETCVVSVQGGDIQWTEDGHMVLDGNQVQVIYQEES